MPGRAVQCQLANDQGVAEVGHDLPGTDEDADRNGEIVGWSILAEVGRCESDRDLAVRESAAGIPNRGADPLLALLHRGIWQAHQDDPRRATSDIDLYFDKDAVESDDCAAKDLGEHSVPLIIEQIVQESV